MPTRINLEDAQNEFIKRGHIPLFDIYNNSHEKLPYKCKCGNENTCHIALQTLKKDHNNCKICIDGKKKETNMKKFGVNNPFQAKDIKEKIKETNLEKYGVENPSLSNKIREKAEQTNLKRFGVKNPSQSNKIREKAKQTNLKRFGVEFPSQTKEIKAKIKQTSLNRYGVNNPLQSKEIKEKIKRTNIEKYGTEYAMQNKEILEKQQNTAFKLKDFTFPESNQTVQVQGYEPYCLNDLLQNEHIDEDDLIDGYECRPTIKYEYDDKTHYYHPDIYIPSKNMIIEVKSSYTYEQNEDINLLKLEATKEAGYAAEIRIYDRKGTCIKKIT